MKHRPNPRTVPEARACAGQELDRRIGGGPAVDDLRERIFRLEAECDLPGLITNNRRAHVAWLIAAAVVCGLITAALPLVNAWAWLQLGPLLDATDGKWTVHSSMQLTTIVLMALFGVIAYCAGARAAWLAFGQPNDGN